MTKAIELYNVGKRYQLGELNNASDYFFDDLIRNLASRLRRKQRSQSETNEFWALKDVTFDVEKGEVVGIIGRNGAGKSTLLKVLSRITRLSTGHINLYGRTGSLLEVGVGFHPELTGRENIYLNGMILGMKRNEITQQFDNIVEFAGVAQFMDTPVKRYSSGMYVRLAFAVAAHLNPEILIVDEVLAVGDVEFQKKSLGKMSDVVHDGRTVLFVSHNMSAIRTICTRVVVLHHGQIVFDGDTEKGIEHYTNLSGLLEQDGIIPADADRLQSSDEVILQRVNITDLDGESIRDIKMGQPFQIHITYDVRVSIPDMVIEVGITTRDGIRFATIFSNEREYSAMDIKPGIQTFIAQFDHLEMMPREYVVDIACHHQNTPKGRKTIEWVEATMQFTANAAGYNGHHGYDWASQAFSYIRGFVRPQVTWQTPIYNKTDSPTVER